MAHSGSRLNHLYLIVTKVGEGRVQSLACLNHLLHGFLFAERVSQVLHIQSERRGMIASADTVLHGYVTPQAYGHAQSLRCGPSRFPGTTLPEGAWFLL